MIFGTIEHVDPKERTVTVNNETYKGDYMMVSLGVEQISEHSLEQFGHNFYTLDGATAIHKELKQFKEGNIAVVVPSLSFKCTAVPYEAVLLSGTGRRESRVCRE